MATSGAMPSRPTTKKKPTPPPPEPPKALSVEERTAYLEERLKSAPAEAQAKYRDDLDMSWIAHDSALEGVVYTLAELRTAMGGNDGEVAFDSSLQPVVEEIRRHREALNFVREQATKKRVPITVDVVKRIYCVLHPEEGDVKTVKYRKDIPQHRLYFHEYAPPDKIAYKLRQVIDWVNDPETRRTRTPVRLAARAHYDLLRIFPVRDRQRQGRAPGDEPAAPARRLSAGHHPLDRAAALLRGAQGLEHDDARHRAGRDREQPRVDREAPRRARRQTERAARARRRRALRASNVTRPARAGKPFFVNAREARHPVPGRTDGRVVKGVRFVGLRDAGDPVECARRYDLAGADEIAFLDITASHEGRGTLLDVVARTADAIFVPLTVGGGVRAEDDVRALLAAGADKVSINTSAVKTPELVAALQRRVGLAGHRRRHRREEEGRRRRLGGLRPRRAHRHGARRRRAGPRRSCGSAPARSCSRAWTATARSPATTSRSRARCPTPSPFPSSPAAASGSLEDLRAGLVEGRASAVLAATIFHDGTCTVAEAKRVLARAGVPVRLVDDAERAA